MEEQRICLVIIRSAEGQRAHLVDKPSFTVGRAQEADLPYLTPSVSRLHLNVEVKGDAAWVVDAKSANGTLLNGNAVEKGKSYRVDPQDIIKLGTAPEEFQFLVIPKPFEMMNTEAQKGTFLGSMEELVKQVERKLEAKFEIQYREEFEKQARVARLEAEEMLSQARQEAEVLKTQGLLGLQNRKQELEAEIGRLEQEAKVTAARERLSSRKVADQMIAEAQKRIQKDYDESSEQMEARLKDIQLKCSAMFEEAEKKSEAVLTDAQIEASRVRREATEEARAIQHESRRKRDEALSGLQAQFQKEIQEKREEILAQAQKDIAQERQQMLSDLMEQTEALRAEIQDQEMRRSELSSAVAQITLDRDRAARELKQITDQSVDARQLLDAVNELEARRAKAENDYKAYVTSRDTGLSKLETELKELKEQRVVEIESRKREQLLEIAKERLKAIEDIKKEIEVREDDYRKTRKLRAIELTQKLQERVTPRFESWSKHPEYAGSEFKTAIEQAVNDCFLNETSIQASVTNVADNAAIAKSDLRTRKIVRWAGMAAGIVLVLSGIYRQELMGYLQAKDKDNYATHLIEQRHNQAIYSPPQDDVFRNTYWENVLFMKGYFDTKSNSEYIEKWTLRLNDLKYLNSIGLSEENVIQFVAKETNLVQQLGTLRNSIDAVYLDEGKKRMRDAEDEAMKEIIPLLKNEATYKEIRKTEKEFLLEFQKQHPLKPDVRPASIPN